MHPPTITCAMRCADDAARVVTLAAASPPIHEILVVPVTPDGFGGLVMAITGTEDPDCLQGVVETVALGLSRCEVFTRLVVASVRPDDGLFIGDCERWQEAGDLAADIGIELIDWLVLGRYGIEYPRLLAGEPARW